MNFKGNIGELENQALEISQNKAHRSRRDFFSNSIRKNFTLILLSKYHEIIFYTYQI